MLLKSITGHVHIDEDGTIFDATLNQTNAANNNNKFYRLQVVVSNSANYYITWTRWDRVGEHGQSKVLGEGTLEDAKPHFDKKFKEKTGHTWKNRLDAPKAGKYMFIERGSEQDWTADEDDLRGAGSRRVSKTSLGSQSSKSVECTLPKAVQRLMSLIFNEQAFAATMASFDYDSKKLPLGKLSKRTLNQGFQVLKDLSELISTPSLAEEEYQTSWDEAVEHLSNRYFTVIPHAFGRNRPPIIHDETLVKCEIELLEALTDMEIATEIMKDAKFTNSEGNAVHPMDRQYAGLGMEEMTPGKHGSCILDFQDPG